MFDNYDDERNDQERDDYSYTYSGEDSHTEELDLSPIEKDEKKRKEKKQGRLSYFIVALVAAIIGGFIAQYLGPILLPNKEAENSSRQDIIINPNDNMSTVTAVAKANMESVVGITTVELQPYLFMMREVEGVGSGVVIDSNGYILTNSHVVGDGQVQKLEVLFEDGEKLPGKVLWSDRSIDVAIVKVDRTGLKAAKLGDSEALEVGEPAIAIGNPLGLEFQRSVTAGIVSGLNRSIKAEGIMMENLIQTDASINRGNSGGPLLNSKGEVIGVNTIKVGSAEGLGFSIPINSIKPIAEDIINTGNYERVSLGIGGKDSEEFGSAFGIEMQTDKGIVVMQVKEGSPADKAGIKLLDIISHIDGEEIESMTNLKKRLYKYKKGDRAVLTVIRDNEEMKVEVKFE